MGAFSIAGELANRRVRLQWTERPVWLEIIIKLNQFAGLEVVVLRGFQKGD